MIDATPLSSITHNWHVHLRFQVVMSCNVALSARVQAVLFLILARFSAGSGEGDGHGDVDEEGPVWLKLALFIGTVSSWSVSDTLSAYVMRCVNVGARALYTHKRIQATVYAAKR